VELVASGEMLQKIAGGGNELIWRSTFPVPLPRSLFIVFYVALCIPFC
jgi:hypothetical protein